MYLEDRRLIRSHLRRYKDVYSALRRASLPREIYLGKFEFERIELISAESVKVKKIFENGRCVDPSISEENGIGY